MENLICRQQGGQYGDVLVTGQQANTRGLRLISTNLGKETKAPYHPLFLPSQREENQPFLFGSLAKLMALRSYPGPLGTEGIFRMPCPSPLLISFI